jgi:hypothetical protein
MYLQEILEVAIGLVFIWLVLSIAAMTIQEWIENIRNGRARDLEYAIRNMLNSDVLTKRLYDHPLIASLYSPSNNPRKKPRLPAYIPASKFAAALFEVVVKVGSETSPLKKLTNQIDAQLAEVLDSQEELKLALGEWQAILDTSRQVTVSGVGQATLDTLKAQVEAFGRKYPEIQPAVDQLFPPVYAFYQDFLEEESNRPPMGTEIDLGMRQFRLGLKIIGGSNPKLKETLAALLRNAQVNFLEQEQAVPRIRAQIENWFNDVMDRLSGAYKRKAQWFSFLIGLFMAILLNIDSINVATNLWREPTLRQAIIAQASDYVSTQQPVASTNLDGSPAGPLQAIPELQRQLQVLNLPFGWIANPIDYNETVNCGLYAPSAYDALGSPTRLLGVHISNVCVPLVNASPVTREYLTGWVTKILGLLLTGMAAAQGAPFWFDILKKFINIRGTGTKPSDTAAVG